MFSGSFGVRSIVLCKCSGKYIDIYFKLKITYCDLITDCNVTRNDVSLLIILLFCVVICTIVLLQMIFVALHSLNT